MTCKEKSSAVDQGYPWVTSEWFQAQPLFTCVDMLGTVSVWQQLFPLLTFNNESTGKETLKYNNIHILLSHWYQKLQVNEWTSDFKLII